MTENKKQRCSACVLMADLTIIAHINSMVLNMLLHLIASTDNLEISSQKTKGYIDFWCFHL